MLTEEVDTVPIKENKGSFFFSSKQKEEIAWAAKVMRSLGVAINQERKTRVYRVSIAQTELSRRFLAEGPPNMEHTYIARHAGKEPIRTIMEKGPVSYALYAPLDVQ